MKRFYYTLAVLMFMVIMLITIVDVCSFNKHYYQKVYHKLDTAETIGVSESDLTIATETLLDYLRGKTDSLDLQVSVDGRTTEMFNQREKDHMVDVKVLYQNAMRIRNIGGIIVAIAAIMSLGSDDYLDIPLNRDMLRNALVISGVVIATIGAVALIDFNSFWITFHKLVFTNDLWLLNPNTDRLIMMVPEPFFMGLVYRIIAGLVSLFLLMLGALGFLEWKVRYDSRRSI